MTTKNKHLFKKHLNKMINVMNTPNIKVITGFIRSRKAKLLLLFKKYLLENVSNVNIIDINLIDISNVFLCKYHD